MIGGGLRDIGGGDTGGMQQAWKKRYLKGGSGAQVTAPSFILVYLVGLIKHLRHERLSQGYANSVQVANASPWGGSSSKAAWVWGIICGAAL